MIPGAPDRLVLTASQLCMNGPAWQVVVEDLVAAYPESGLRPEADHASDYARQDREIRGGDQPGKFRAHQHYRGVCSAGASPPGGHRGGR